MRLPPMMTVMTESDPYNNDSHQAVRHPRRSMTSSSWIEVSASSGDLGGSGLSGPVRFEGGADLEIKKPVWLHEPVHILA